MKKLLLACLLFTGWSQAQNITFKDSIVKTIIVSKFDKNADKEIDLSEADKVDTLYLYDSQLNPIGDISDLVNFTNINKLIINAQLIDSVKLDYLNKLTHFGWQFHKKVKSLDLNLISINTLEFWQGEEKTSLNDLNLTKYPNVVKLYIEDLLTGDIKFDFWPKLNHLHMNNYYNTDTILNSVDLSKNTELQYLNMQGYTTIKKLDLSQNLNLIDVRLSRLDLKSIDLTKNLALKNLFISDIVLQSIDLTKNLALKNLEIDLTSIKSIDLSKNSKLDSVSLSLLSINSLDFSNCNQIEFIYFYGLDSLTYLNVKNGKREVVCLYGARNLKYICSDEEELNTISDSLKLNSISLQLNSITAEVNSFCSFTPGGLHNTITNVVRFDAIGNCTGNDKFLPYTKFIIEDPNGKGISVTNNQGEVNFYKQKGLFTLTPQLENPNYYQISPSLVNFNLMDNSGHDTTINFCITPKGIHNDLEIVLAPIGRARPGFDSKYLVTYKNKGNQTLSGDFTVEYNEDVLDLVASSLSPITTGKLGKSFADLKPFEVISTDTIVFNVNSPIETPAVNINDTLKFKAKINPIQGDETPEDNVFKFNQRVVGAYDPNLITCLEGNVLPSKEIGKTVHYTIEFENTGNFPAENIVVVETIDPKKFDINSIQILNTSHPMKLRIEGNKVEYYFQNIDLGEHKHGNILLKLRALSNLIEGDTVNKQANIYFDYNAPVETNKETTVYKDQLLASIKGITLDESIIAYPNPNNGLFTLKAANQISSVEIYDLNGRSIQTIIVNDFTNKIDLSNQDAGIYLLKVTTDTGANVIEIKKD